MGYLTEILSKNDFELFYYKIEHFLIFYMIYLLTRLEN